MFSKFLKFLSIIALVLVVAGWSFKVLAEPEPWVAPTADPPRENRDRPINTSDLPQKKGGSLYLTNSTAALVVDGVAPLIFGYHPGTGNKYFGFKADPNNADAVSQIWTLPITDGVSGAVLTTNGAGQLIWTKPDDLMTQDTDWQYVGSPPSYTSIYSNLLTRIGSGAPGNHTTGVGDLYVQKNLQVDGLIYEQSALGNAEIQLQSGTNTHWGIYQDITGGELRFWNNNDNIIFTNNGGVRIRGLLYDSSGNTPTGGQILSNNGTAIKWTDPTWWTVSDYIYSALNTRIGNGGTIDQASGAGDLYVQNKLEVDGNTYLHGLTVGGDSYFKTINAGNIIPTANNTYDLGSATNSWKNIFAETLNLTGGLNLNFTSGSVIFQGNGGLAQNNSKFFWDNANGRLGLGTNTPTQALDVAGNLKLADTTFDKTAGAIYLGNEVFIHNAAKSSLADFPTYETEYYSNTYVGRQAGTFPATADDEFLLYDNSALGFWALKNNQAYANTAVGSRALANDIGGYKNSAFGAFSSTNNTGGYLNSSFGYNSLFSNATGNYNTAFGADALKFNTNSNNAAFGMSALKQNTSGSKNAALGFEAGKNNSTGAENLFLGAGSGIFNSTGGKNVYAGYYAGYLHSTGDENVFVGYNAGYNNTTGSSTVAFGSGAGHNGSGNSNTFLGNKAGWYEMGSNKLYIENSDANANNALIYGQFYSATTSTSPMLRFNGNVGITPRGTVLATPNSLLHLYQPTGSYNAELDIQSFANDGTFSNQQRQWSIYQDRGTRQLRFWNAFAGANGYDLANSYNNLLTLSDKGRVGIGLFAGDDPESRLDVHGVGDNVLTLSSYNNGATTGGVNVLKFLGVKTTGGKWTSAEFTSGFATGTADPYNGAYLSLNLPQAVDGKLVSRANFKNEMFTFAPELKSLFLSRVEVNGTHDEGNSIYTLAVNGSIHGHSYYAGDDSQGASEYVCVAVPGGGSTLLAKLLRFEDGLYICSCMNQSGSCNDPGGNCTCP